MVVAQSLIGNIKDKISNQVLNEAFIKNLNSETTTVSDAQGNFSIRVKGGDRILIKYPGHVDLEFILPAELGNVFRKNIRLSPTFYNLDEVIVYPKLSKRQQDSLKTRYIFGEKVEQKQEKFGLNNHDGTGFGLVFDNPITGIYQRYNKKYKRLRKFQAQFKADEETKYIESRYSLEEIEAITGLKGDSLIAFRNQNPMPLEIATTPYEVEFKSWIMKRYKEWIKNPIVLETE